MIKVTAIRNAGKRTDAYNLVYTTTVMLNGVAVPATLTAECLGAGKSTLKRFQHWLIETTAESQDLITEYYPKGLKSHYPFVVEGINFALDVLPVAPIETLLPLVWTAFRKELRDTVLQYHIEGYTYKNLGGVVTYTEKTYGSYGKPLSFTFKADQDLYVALEEILLNFVLGAVNNQTWRYESDTLGVLTVTDPVSKTFNHFDTAPELYRIFTGAE